MRTLLCWLLMTSVVWAGAPVRVSDYVPGTPIVDTQVEGNEDPIYEYLQNGVEVIAPGAVTTATIQDNAITTGKILDGTITTADLAFTIAGGALLPSGAIYFMVTGSCPSGTTDVTATYANMFVRVNATGGTFGGSDTHTHDAGTYAAPSHTHTNTDISQAVAWSASVAVGAITSTSAVVATDFDTKATQASGNGAITGASASQSNVPAYFTAKACQVN